MTTTSSRFRPSRRPGTAAVLLVSLCTTARSPRPAAPQAPQQLTLWSGIAAEFTNALIHRFNGALRHARIALQPTSGGVVVAVRRPPPTRLAATLSGGDVRMVRAAGSGRCRLEE